jgi:hypothetical protein
MFQKSDVVDGTFATAGLVTGDAAQRYASHSFDGEGAGLV